MGSATPSSSSSTPTQSTTSTAAPEVQVPAAATKRTAAGAEAFAKYYWTQVGQSLVAVDSSRIRSLSTDSCADCRGLFEVVQTMRTKGERAERSSFDIKLVTWVSGNAAAQVVEVAGKERPVRVLNGNGDVLRTSKSGVFTWSTSVVWQENRWLVDSFKGL
ncbi:DUF6318 family protein [Pedococcus ginsenosidimutans]|uniref:DUF6318 family protein n=1 Tax=Pedococcus ginsenosidimutans TaxID=490570 RepID=UPI0031EDC81B